MDNFELEDRTVLLRLNLDSPIDTGTYRILDDTKFREHLPTIKSLKNSKVVILAHQSMPGKKDFTTLDKHADKLTTLVGRKVMYIDDLFGTTARTAIKDMTPGDIILLENTRFYSEEFILENKSLEIQSTANLVTKLVPHVDFFINDAFSLSHFSQPSLVGFAQILPNIAGKLMEREIKVSSEIDKFNKPIILIVGGAKPEEMLKVISNVLRKNQVDKVLTCGIIGNIFLIARGYSLGYTTEQFTKEFRGIDSIITHAKALLSQFENRIMTPADVAINDNGKRKRVELTELPVAKPIQDVDVDTVVRYSREIKNANTVIYIGTAGVMEIEEFALGTTELLNAVSTSSGFSVLGGTHTVLLARKLGIDKKIGHISTGSVACTYQFANISLPVFDALKLSKKIFEGLPYKIK
jgi:phosphoglycerate kinase